MAQVVKPVTQAEVESLVAQYPGLRERLDSEVGPRASIVSCGTKNAEGEQCGKPIAFVVNLSRLRDAGLTEKGAFPLRPVDATRTLSGEFAVSRAAQHECLAR